MAMGPYRLPSLFASCAFHGVVLGALVGLTLVYRPHLPPLKTGSAPGTPTITLEKIALSLPLQQPTPLERASQLSTNEIPAPTPNITASAISKSRTRLTPPDATVPALALRPKKPAAAAAAKIPVKVHAAEAKATPAKSPLPTNRAMMASTSSSSYAPGPNVLPHPPYPEEARSLGETGTVIINVQFDARGDVLDSNVAQSSGVAVLDSETRSYILTHWHSATFAGQTVSVPVQYSLKKL